MKIFYFETKKLLNFFGYNSYIFIFLNLQIKFNLNLIIIYLIILIKIIFNFIIYLFFEIFCTYKFNVLFNYFAF